MSEKEWFRFKLDGAEYVVDDHAYVARIVRETDRIIETHSVEGVSVLGRAYLGLAAENERLRKCVEAADAKFEHLSEYWNRNENERAMSDACWHVIEECEAWQNDAARKALEEKS